MTAPVIQEMVRSFRSMNTDVQVVVVTDDAGAAEGVLDQVRVLFESTERTLSRFLPDSDLSGLNRSAGRPYAASPLLFQAVSEALLAARATSGLFDPTVLASLVAAGYDRSFELLDESRREPAPVNHRSEGTVYERTGTRYGEDSLANKQPRNVRSGFSWRDVHVDEKAGTITLPAGVGLDLGGIGKGWTVDRAANLLRSFGAFAVDAGGDIYLAGRQMDGSPWTVGIEDPLARGKDVAVLAVQDRAVATSTTSRRRWLREGREQHHLIDPRSGQPAHSGVVSVTVVATTVARAEVLAKVALLLGPEDGLHRLEKERGVEGVLVLEGGDLVFTEGFREVFHGA